MITDVMNYQRQISNGSAGFNAYFGDSDLTFLRLIGVWKPASKIQLNRGHMMSSKQIHKSLHQEGRVLTKEFGQIRFRVEGMLASKTKEMTGSRNPGVGSKLIVNLNPHGDLLLVQILEQFVIAWKRFAIVVLEVFCPDR